MEPGMTVRPATRADAADLARIYNEGIVDRVATFETDLRSETDVLAWFDRSHPIVVVEAAAKVLGYAASSPSSGRCCYAKNADFSVYVSREARGRGAGRLAIAALVEAAREAGFAKLLSGVFVDNGPSRALLRRAGFREVGVHERHGQLDGVWRDVVIVERIL